MRVVNDKQVQESLIFEDVKVGDIFTDASGGVCMRIDDTKPDRNGNFNNIVVLADTDGSKSLQHFAHHMDDNDPIKEIHHTAALYLND